MDAELPGQMPLFDLTDVQPDEECEGCALCLPPEVPAGVRCDGPECWCAPTKKALRDPA